MSNYPIHLGKKSTSFGPPVSLSHMPEKPEEPTEHFPTLYLEWEKNYEMPDSGEMTVKFKKARETNTEDRRGTRQSLELEVLEIISVKAKKGYKKEESSEEAIDKLAKEADETGDDE